MPDALTGRGPVLVVAAHPDDEALGCGGVMARHAAAGDAVHVLFMTNGVGSRDDVTATAEGQADRRAGAENAAKILGANSPRFFDFPDNQLDSVPLLEIAQAIEAIAQEVEPAVVYTHHEGDLNIDHQLCARAALTAFRAIPGRSVRAVYGFEVASSTEWRFGGAEAAFAPQRFVNITEQLDLKRDAMSAYEMEMRPWPHARSHEALLALAHWRGATVGVEAAEALTVLREVV